MTHMVEMEELVKKLRIAKIRATLPRMLILQVLCESGQAMTAYEIEKAVSGLNSTLFLTSIYTVLRSLEQANIIQRYHKLGERQAVFSIKKQHHPIICECLTCKKQIAVEQTLFDDTLQQLYRQQQLNVKQYNLILQVECAECSAS